MTKIGFDLTRTTRFVPVPTERRPFMSTTESFGELLIRVRDGDPEAASEIVARYASAIRIAVRTRMSDPALRRQFDSMDVCQSVLGSFFLRMAAGLYDVEEPAQLAALLTGIARNKVLMRVRREQQACRDSRRVRDLGAAVDVASCRETDPSESAMRADLVERAYALMDAESREVARQRMNAASWSEIAATLGGTAEGRRKQFERAIHRVAVALGVDDER